MDGRAKHGLRDLWWFLLATAVLVTILCTSLLAGRRLSSEKNIKTCDWLPGKEQQQPLVDQVIIVIIDALTPRVALGPPQQQQQEESSSSTSSSRDASWFTYIRDELERSRREQSIASLGFFSVADAPTTTAQRTKAMVTGTIPVLLEAGASFNSFAVEEDNLLEKLGGRVAVLGDDTWVRLFPEESNWQRAHVFESFDVRDLHTVDNGVLEHLNSVLTNSEEQLDKDTTDETKENNKKNSPPPPPRLIISHFLGVDHAGHQYSARDPHLFAKVGQLNKVLRNVSQLLERRRDKMSTLLLVMGDHGMTESGDHGGSTPSETDTFLFSQVFPKHLEKKQQQQQQQQQSSFADLVELTRWFTTSVRRQHCSFSRLCRITLPEEIARYCARAQCASANLPGLTAIHQIDLVPTLAAVFGLPTPKQNLGRLAPEIVLQALVAYCSSSSGGDDAAVCSQENIEASLEKLFECNVDQLRAAFCSEFSVGEENPLCRRQSPSSSSSSSFSSSRSFKERIEHLDEMAAQLTRAAREALTDADLAAVVCALFLGFLAGFVSVWHYLLSWPISLRWRSLRELIFFNKSNKQKQQQKQQRAAVVKFFASWAVLACLLILVGDCKSKICILVALPMFLVTFFSVDGDHWFAQAFEILPVIGGGDYRTPRRFLFTGAGIAFLGFSVKIGVQMANSFIVREDVISCIFAISLMLLCQHTQLQVPFWKKKKKSEGNSTKTTTRTSSVYTVLILGAICSLSLKLGRRVRDFDSHFVDARSLAQEFQAAFIEWFFTSSSPSHRGSSLPGSLGLESNALRSFEERLAHHGHGAAAVALFASLRWLFFESCFIHFLLAGTIAAALLVNFLLNRLAFFRSTRFATPATRARAREWSWRAVFAAGFVWNAAVSNVTSLQAFLCQSLFLVLWARWFPFSKLRRIDADDEAQEDVMDGGGGSGGLVVSSSSIRSARFLLVSPGVTLLSFKRRVVSVCNAFDGLVLHLIGWLFFFAAGSQCMFSTIDWNMGFVGVDGVNMAAAGFLITVHTLRPFIVNLVVALYVDQWQRRGDAEEDHHDDHVKKKKRNSSNGNVVGLGATLVFVNASLCVTMCYSMVRHRGHLMVWEVFFPRFAYEVGVFVVSVAAAAVMTVL